MAARRSDSSAVAAIHLRAPAACRNPLAAAVVAAEDALIDSMPTRTRSPT
jgi:hypothetical protein